MRVGARNSFHSGAGLTGSVDRASNNLTREHDGRSDEENGTATHLVDRKETGEGADHVDTGEDELRLVRVVDARSCEEL